MDQWEQSPVGTTLGTMVGQRSSRPTSDDASFSTAFYNLANNKPEQEWLSVNADMCEQINVVSFLPTGL